MLINLINKLFNNINKIFSYITEEKFDDKMQFYNCMSELFILLKNTLKELNNIYSKFVLEPKLNKL